MSPGAKSHGDERASRIAKAQPQGPEVVFARHHPVDTRERRCEPARRPVKGLLGVATSEFRANPSFHFRALKNVLNVPSVVSQVVFRAMLKNSKC